MKTRLAQVKFYKTVVSLEGLPVESLAEVAFAGRSNVGKSSTINKLTNQKRLAHISKTPGRTQALNYFAIDEQHFLVDLPGYGYAKVSKAIKSEWQELLENYIAQSRNLHGVLLIVDVRHELQLLDRQMCEWLCHLRRPLHVILNKADKLSKGKQQNAFYQMQKEVQQLYPDASVQLFSAETGLGVEQAEQQIWSWLYGEDI